MSGSESEDVDMKRMLNTYKLHKSTWIYPLVLTVLWMSGTNVSALAPGAAGSARLEEFEAGEPSDEVIDDGESGDSVPEKTYVFSPDGDFSDLPSIDTLPECEAGVVPKEECKCDEATYLKLIVIVDATKLKVGNTTYVTINNGPCATCGDKNNKNNGEPFDWAALLGGAAQLVSSIWSDGYYAHKSNNSFINGFLEYSRDGNSNVRDCLDVVKYVAAMPEQCMRQQGGGFLSGGFMGNFQNNIFGHQGQNPWWAGSGMNGMNGNYQFNMQQQDFLNRNYLTQMDMYGNPMQQQMPMGFYPQQQQQPFYYGQQGSGSSSSFGLGVDLPGNTGVTFQLDRSSGPNGPMFMPQPQMPMAPYYYPQQGYPQQTFNGGGYPPQGGSSVSTFGG